MRIQFFDNLFQQLCYALFFSTKLHKHIFENVRCTVWKEE